MKHHGAEELRTFDMGSVEWDYGDVGQLLGHANWFEPTQDGIGLGKVVRPEYFADPEVTKIISDGGRKA